jgi:hypothetical protein
MNDMELKALLREAGKERQEFAPVHVNDIRTLARGRVRRRRTLGGVGALVLIASLAAILLRGTQEVKKTPPPPVAEKQPEPPAYLASAQALQAHIEEEALARLDRRRAAAALAAGEVISLEDAREQAAGTMVMLAPRRGELAGVQEAAAVYRRTIAIFPETPSAQAARLALAQLHLPN